MKKYLTIIFALLVLAGLVAFFYAERQLLFPNQNTGTTASHPGDVSPSGTIYLTLSTPGGPLQTSVLDLSTKTLQASPNPGTLSDVVSPAFSKDGSRIAFAGRIKQGDPYQIYVMGASVQNMKQLTNTNRLYKREPIWSDDGTLIAYTIQRENQTLDLSLPQSWAVYLVDMSGKTMFVTQGIDPFFSPDGKTLFVLMDDGIHAFDMDPIKAAMAGVIGVASPNFESTVVAASPGGVASQKMKIAISSDKTMLSWSDVLTREVRVYSIRSWAPFTLALKREIPVYAYWTLFSPDNTYLALQEVDWINNQPTNARVVVINLQSGNMNVFSDLSSYYIKYMWMSAWK